MICVSLPGPTETDLLRQMEESQGWADLFEFRCDLYPDIVSRVVPHCHLPKIFTCHHESFDTIRHLANLNPEYMDLDQSIPLAFQKELPSSIKIIRSIHFFHDTPKDLQAVFHSLTTHPAHLYKIATFAKSTLDSLRLLCFSQSIELPLSVVAMGELGQCSRILGPSIGAPIVYASPNAAETTASGQISAKELKSIYSMQKNQKLYGLIGDPVSQSYGHIYHNDYMKDKGAIYVRLRIKSEELEEFFSLARQMGFAGLSVTIPHKEAVIPFLDEIDHNSAAIGAVNTITCRNGAYVGSNTDAAASIDALGIPVKDKMVVVIGAGGASRAIVYEAKRRGARVVIVNRHYERAKRLSEKFGCTALKPEDLGQYDILINATPNPMPIDPHYVHPNITAMDISIAPDTDILQLARERGGTAIQGREMFERQAKAQAREWGQA